MNNPQSFNRLYTNISDSINSAMADILSLNVEHDEGKRQIGNITDKLRDIQARFDSELHQLETQAEWETFTLAFFGETNAGKSTIIESLRILFEEESRQALLQQYADDLEQFKQVLTAHLESAREGLYDLYNEYANELSTINQSIDSVKKIAQNEAEERLELERQEAKQRLQIEQSNALSRFKARLALFSGGGVLIGAAATAALLKLAGA